MTCTHVLRPWKISEHLTKLMCLKCGREVASWEDKISPGKQAQRYSDKTLESLK